MDSTQITPTKNNQILSQKERQSHVDMDPFLVIYLVESPKTFIIEEKKPQAKL